VDGGDPFDLPGAGTRVAGEWNERSVLAWRDGNYVALPGRIWAVLCDPALPYDVGLVLDAGEDQRFVVTQMIVRPRTGGQVINTKGMRAIPVAALVEEALSRSAAEVATPTMSEGGELQGISLLGRTDRTFDVSRFAVPVAKRRGRSATIRDAELDDVARVYREGKADHRGIEAVREWFLVGRSTAHRAIRRAIDAGHLDEAEVGPQQTRNRKKGTQR
jgi:hypothetical protein